MTNTVRKKIVTTNLTFWIIAVVVTCLLVFVAEGRAKNLIPVAVAVCGWISMLSINSTLSRGESADKKGDISGTAE